MKKKIKIEKRIKIQPAERKDLTLPYPYFIYAKGLVGRQDFWKGEPLYLMGFAKDQKVHIGQLTFEQFWKNPKKCVGLFPIFENKKGKWHTYQDKIESIRVD